MAELDGVWYGPFEISRLLQERDDAQEAAANYHQAWQDAAVWWIDKVGHLKFEVKRLQGIVDYQADYIGQYRAENEAQRNRISILERQLEERAMMHGELSVTHSELQVAWGGDASRLNVLMDGVVDEISDLPEGNILRQELMALVNRIDREQRREREEREKRLKQIYDRQEES